MKCDKCEDLMYEYLDAVLPPDVQEAIEEHLAQCPACCAAFRQERQFSKSMTELFERQTRDLRLSPQIRQNVLTRLQRRPALIVLFNRLPREIMKIAAVIAILFAGFYAGNALWQKKNANIRAKLERETDWRYILVSPRTGCFLDHPELQLMRGGKYREN